MAGTMRENTLRRHGRMMKEEIMIVIFSLLSRHYETQPACFLEPIE